MGSAELWAVPKSGMFLRGLQGTCLIVQVRQGNRSVFQGGHGNEIFIDQGHYEGGAAAVFSDISS